MTISSRQQPELITEKQFFEIRGTVKYTQLVPAKLECPKGLKPDQIPIMELTELLKVTVSKVPSNLADTPPNADYNVSLPDEEEVKEKYKKELPPHTARITSAQIKAEKKRLKKEPKIYKKAAKNRLFYDWEIEGWTSQPFYFIIYDWEIESWPPAQPPRRKA